MSRRDDVEFVRGRLFQVSMTLVEHGPDTPMVFAPSTCDIASMCIAYIGENLSDLPPKFVDLMVATFTADGSQLGPTLLEMIAKAQAEQEAAKKAHAEADDE